MVEAFEHIDDTDGFPEKSLMKKNQEFFKARNVSFFFNLISLRGSPENLLL